MLRPRRSHDSHVNGPDGQQQQALSASTTAMVDNNSNNLDAAPTINDGHSATHTPPPPVSSSKRLGGYIADKLQPLAGHLHHHRPSNNNNRDGPSSPPPPLHSPLTPTMPTTNKQQQQQQPQQQHQQQQQSQQQQQQHTQDSSKDLNVSPSKPMGRTYDPKLVSREMHRLGSLAHLPAALAPAAPSSLSAPPPLPNALSTSSNDPWGSLHVHVLPLFNAESLRVPIEDLNVLVKRHIQIVISSAPSKALATLEHDASDLIASGMVTLHAKLADIKDERLIDQTVEIWTQFWNHVLPYVEGVLLPMQSDPLLSSLYRAPPRHHNAKKSSVSSNIQASATNSPHIDIRTVALRCFRDKVVIPFSQRLSACLSSPSHRQESPRLQQMLLVLSSQTRQPTPTFSLASPGAKLTSEEAAVASLLRLMRSPSEPKKRQFSQRASRRRFPTSVIASPTISNSSYGHKNRSDSESADMTPRALTFSSTGRPRDRRARIVDVAGYQYRSLSKDEEPPEQQEEDRTPINGGGRKGVILSDPEREFLESLKSPDIEGGGGQKIGSGGWGLGNDMKRMGGTNGLHEEDEEEGEEQMDWDQAQALVERMVGMKPNRRAT